MASADTRKSVLYSPVKDGDPDRENMVHTKDPVVSIIGLAHIKSSLENGTASKKSKRGTWAQLLACCSVQAVQALAGLAMGHSSSLIPQLEAENSEIPLTRSQSAWIASLITLTVPLGSILGGWLTDAVGRLNSVKLSTIPYLVSCVLIATAQSFVQLLVGRLIVGACIGMGFTAALLYTAEVAEKNVRGILSCLGTAFASLGILLGYIAGAYLSWRTCAWTYCGAPVLLIALLFAFATESPVWLREHGKLEAARKASMYFYQDPDKVLSAAKPTDAGSNLTVTQKLGILFTKPAGLKPFLLINMMFFLQQISGVYITVSFAVTFFQESGSDLDPYIATILLGLIRLVFVTSTSLMAGRIGRRPFMIFSATAMGVCMLTSAFATRQILTTRAANEVPAEWLSWVVVGSILAYVAFGGMGVQVLPWGMMAELFPHEVRSLAQPINTGTAHVYMFVLLQLYPALSYLLGGSSGVQFLFASTCFFTALFSWLFLLETRGLTLQEIEEYFSHNTFYPGSKKRAEKRHQNQTSAGA